MLEKFRNNLRRILSGFFNYSLKAGQDDEYNPMARREKIVVFLAAFVLAMALWAMVNLSRDYNISMNLPVQVGGIPNEKSLSEPLPDAVTVSVNGDGWKLVSMYNNPPVINLDIGSEGEINLFDQVRDQMNTLPDVSISKVQPSIISVQLEDRVSKKIPVRIQTDIKYRARYARIGLPEIEPDSVTVTGSSSQLQDINEWTVEDTLRIVDVKEDFSVNVPLNNQNQLIQLSDSEIIYSEDVAEFTEGETTVFIKTRGLPRGRSITYNPSSVVIRYSVPISEYSEVQDIKPYEAYVPYRKILEDSTGFVTPDIELKTTQFNIRLKNVQPRTIAYFSVLDD